MYSKEFSEKMKEIQELGAVKYVAYHVIEDEVAPRETILVQDVTGQEVEIFLYDIFGYSNLQLLVLISVLMDKVLNHVVLPIDDITKAIKEARQMYPYKGKRWVNEEISRRCDYYAPEYKI